MTGSTEVRACWAPTSVFVHRRQGKLMLNLPKYLLVSRLLRYTHTAGRANSCYIYRSICLFGAYFGIHTPPAGQTLAAFTEVLACLPATSVFTRRRQGLLKLHLPKYWLVCRLLRYSHAAGRTNQCFKYRSFSLLGGYFGIRIPPAGQTLAAFTEVLACFAATSVFVRRRQGLLKLHLPKYWLVCRLLRYS